MKLDVKALNKSYDKKTILHDISFSVDGGNTMGFLGRNGAGKTTTLRILAGMFGPDAGEVLLDGRPLNRKQVKVGYLPEEKGMYPKVGVMDQLIYIGRLKGMHTNEAETAAKNWLERFELSDCARKMLGVLSKGNQQKVQIIQSIINNPDILILDEPFSGLDPVNARFLKTMLRDFEQEKKLVIFSNHEMVYVEEFCHDITFIKSGVILLSGNLKEVKQARGNNKVCLRIRGMENERLLGVLSETAGFHPNMVGKEVVVGFTDNYSASDLLKEAVNRNWQLESFRAYEPTLDEIFIETDRLEIKPEKDKRI